MAVNPALARVAAGQIAYAQEIGQPNDSLQVASDALMHCWYRTRAVVFQRTGSFSATATTRPFRWRMHTPEGVTNFGLIVRGQTSSGTAVVHLERVLVRATVTLTTSVGVVFDLAAAAGAMGSDHTWSLRVVPTSNTVTITDFWVVWPNITT